MAEVNEDMGRTFKEYSIIPGYTPEECNIQTVSTQTRIADGVDLGIPLLSAAMTSVTGYDMALSLGKEKGMGVLPMRLPIEEQAGIVRKLKRPERGFVEDPLKARENDSLESVVKKMENHGHTKIPVVNKHNLLQGIFLQEIYMEGEFSAQQPMKEVMIPFEKDSNDVPYTIDPEISANGAQKFLNENNTSYMIVLTEDDRLEKMAFKKDFKEVKVGAAISTHSGWKERVEAIVSEGVDMVFIDTSDGYNSYVDKVLSGYKNMKTDVPICAGNVISYEATKHLIEKGADAVKIGMSSGSICTTAGQKGVGRAPMTALLEATRARDEVYDGGKGKYVPVIVDGGISNAPSMAVALTEADACMAGGYFNKFWEAEGEKYDAQRQPTNVEEEVKFVETYGEGSEHARSLSRYGHTSTKTFFAEGEKGIVEYAGRLKPNIKKDTLKVKAAMVNAGCMDFEEYRKNSKIELMSPASRGVVSTTHDMNVE